MILPSSNPAHSASKPLQLHVSKRGIDERRPCEAHIIPHLHFIAYNVRLCSVPFLFFSLLTRNRARERELTSAPYSPTVFAIGPMYHTCAIHRIAPTQPTRNATNAAAPTGSFDRSFHAVQLYPLPPLPRRKRKCSSKVIAIQIATQYPMSARKFVKITLSESRPARAQTVYTTTPNVFQMKRGTLAAYRPRIWKSTPEE